MKKINVKSKFNLIVFIYPITIMFPGAFSLSSFYDGLLSFVWVFVSFIVQGILIANIHCPNCGFSVVDQLKPTSKYYIGAFKFTIEKNCPKCKYDLDNRSENK